jgi:trans-aconitate 2-methyltransferase
MPWNPDRYNQFQQQRFAPFADLSALVRVRDGLRVIDLGCGTGELTRRLADMLPGSDVLGIDSSPEMLSKATAFARPGLRFEQRAIEDVDGQWDVIFSHAALQWLDDHSALFRRLAGMLTPGGQLAVQMPSNYHHYSHVAARELCQSEPFYSALGGWTRGTPVLPITDYAELLFNLGLQDIVVFEKIYPHVLENADAIADWTSGTLLVPIMERLPEALHERFMAAYRERLRDRWPDSPVFYGFQRLLFSAFAPEEA